MIIPVTKGLRGAGAMEDLTPDELCEEISTGDQLLGFSTSQLTICLVFLLAKMLKLDMASNG